MVRQCVPIPQKIHPITKRLKTPSEEVEIFSWPSGFYRFHEQQIPRPVDKERRKMYYYLGKKKHTVKNSYG